VARDPERAALLEEAEALLLEELPDPADWSFGRRNLVDPRLEGFAGKCARRALPEILALEVGRSAAVRRFLLRRLAGSPGLSSPWSRWPSR